MVELEALDVAALQLDDALEVGEEGDKVVVRSRLLPRALGNRGGPRRLRSQLRRNATGLVPLTPGQPNQIARERVVGVELGLNRVERSAKLVRRQPLMAKLRQRGQVLGAHPLAAGRHLGALVPGEKRTGAAEIRDLAGDLTQLVVRGAH